MKRFSKLLALIVALCMILSVGAFASGDPSGEASSEMAGTYSDGVFTLVIADDLTFTMEKTGTNMEGEEFVLLVSGTVSGDGVFTINGLYDGEINLIEVASEEQLAADLASVETAYAAGSTASGGSDWDAYIAYLTDLVNTDTGLDIHDQLIRELSEVTEADYAGMLDGTMFGAIGFQFGAMSYEEFQAQG